MRAFIHVNMHQMKTFKPAITIRLHEPRVDGSTEEKGIYRCRRLSWDGPTLIQQDDPRRLQAGARIWIDIDADDIEWVDDELPPWLPEAPKGDQ